MLPIMSYFNFTSPTTIEWLRLIEAHKTELLDTTQEATIALYQTQEDVYAQFDQKQSQWTPLKEFTVNKKQRLDLDSRILHETKKGQGVRLRDAYRKTGRVENGKLIFFYPPSKPYAKEHQEGATINAPKRRKKEYESPRAYGIRKNQEKRDIEFLDTQFLRSIGINPLRYE